MAIDKRWGETFTRLEAIESELQELRKAIKGTPQTAVTKSDLMKIAGVGSSTADKILELLNS